MQLSSRQVHHNKEATAKKTPLLSRIFRGRNGFLNLQTLGPAQESVLCSRNAPQTHINFQQEWSVIMLTQPCSLWLNAQTPPTHIVPSD
ncbi:hypothetical protein DPEC_G00234420 [Dallia pectoralis]|uniref:Uncharacterized protein n=1 Tax=Dallia pectoralis TaxID=75939 RepID=A0ACC2FXP0_DALPE|nr:hypothetical protein DPEC_G00234420 [Dallia pectoralis]